MAVFWFLIALLFLILFLNKKSEKKGDDDGYRHGYWDGYRAFGEKVQGELNNDHIDRERLVAFIAEGYPDLLPPSETSIQLDVEDEPDTPIFNQAATAITPRPQSVAELTPDQREAKTVRNLNTILYVASFLLVAAAAVFVAASMPAGVRLLGIWTVAILFYVVGLVLHQNIPRLRSAGIAFTGTGLAILPFAGFAMHSLGDVSGQTAWLLTSVIGVVAYFVAALIIKSQLVSYLTMAFVLSLALSSVAVTSAPIVWYFILLISVSLLASTISFLKPTWLPELFRQPIDATGQIVTPIALVASIVVYQHMSLLTYELVFAVATAHYLVVWLQTRSLLYETIVRLAAHGALLLICLDIVDFDAATFAIYWLVIAAVQAGYSLLRLKTQNSQSRTYESSWLGGSQAMILFGTVLWISSENAALGTLMSFMTIGVISILATLRLRQVLWAIPALIVSLVAPFIVGRWLSYPIWEWQLIAWIFIIGALTTVAVYYLERSRRTLGALRFLQASFWLYIAISIMTVLGQFDAMATGWVAIVAALLTVLFSYVSRQAWAEVVGGMLLILAVAAWLWGDVLSIWYITTVVLVSAGILYAIAGLHYTAHQTERRDALLTLAQVTLAGLVFNISSDTQVAITSLVLLLVAAVASFGARIATEQKVPALRQLLTISYFIYIGIAWLLSFNLEVHWSLVVYGVMAVLFWGASYVERAPGLVVGGNVALVAAITALWHWLGLSSEWMLFGVAWIAATILYGAYWLLGESQDIWRRQACLVSVWVLLGWVALLQFTAVTTDQGIAAAGTLVVLAGTVAVHGYLERNRSLIELAVYLATFGAQRMASLMMPELGIVFYAHWWAIVIGLVAWWRRAEPNFTNRLMIAVGFITASTGLKALEEGGGYQLLFLIEHIGLLVIGALKQAAWALWWGVAATIVAVLYFLKDYPYIALAFLGLVLIAIVIWRLIHPSDKSDKDGSAPI